MKLPTIHREERTVSIRAAEDKRAVFECWEDDLLTCADAHAVLNRAFAPGPYQPLLSVGMV